ncbi:MAG: hypothetical protein ACK5LY_11110 [Lachnospirales bacterium]
MNVKKIVLMSQLALYEKKYGKDDIKNSNYYRSDFVYLKNMWTRAFAILGAFLLMILYFLDMYAEIGLEEMVLYLRDNYMAIVYYLIGVIILYTIIGTFMYSSEYKNSKKRVESYSRLLDKINKITEEEKNSMSNEERNDAEF